MDQEAKTARDPRYQEGAFQGRPLGERTDRLNSGGIPEKILKDAAEDIEARIRTLEIEGRICAAAAQTWKEKSDEAFARAGEIRDLFRKVSRA